jgi:hypothetical protein
MKSFIQPYRGIIKQPYRQMIRKSSTLHAISPHQTYDIAVASTYGLFYLLGYENYPVPLKRRDVEVVGIIFALLWDITHRFDPTIFILLVGVGGISFLSEKSIMDKSLASQLHLGVHLCGYISFVLFIFDVISFFIY